MSQKRNLLKAIAIPLIGGTIAGTLATRSAKKQYQELETPPYAPPGWVFPIAWTTLYTVMGIAKHQFNEVPKNAKVQTKTDIIYATQLGFNYVWSFLFFRWNLRGMALIDAALLCTSVAANTRSFYKESKLAGTLMLPYLAWTTYAVALNYDTWQLNKNKRLVN